MTSHSKPTKHWIIKGWNKRFLKLSPAAGSTSISIIKIHDCIIDPTKRVFSGIKAILDFQIINFREYDCTKEPESPNCRIVELFLTVDTTRKMQNGVNIDKSIDRCEFFDFYQAKITFSEGWIFWKMMSSQFSVRKSIQNRQGMDSILNSNQDWINKSVWGGRTKYGRVMGVFQ